MAPRILATVIWAALSLAVVAQAPSKSDPIVEIRSPTDDTYLAGPVVFRATVDPPSAVERVSFQVDGREVCTIEKPPFDCEWDAGHDVEERAVRMVVYFV